MSSVPPQSENSYWWARCTCHRCVPPCLGSCPSSAGLLQDMWQGMAWTGQRPCPTAFLRSIIWDAGSLNFFQMKWVLLANLSHNPPSCLSAAPGCSGFCAVPWPKRWQTLEVLPPRHVVCGLTGARWPPGLQEPGGRSSAVLQP